MTASLSVKIFVGSNFMLLYKINIPIENINVKNTIGKVFSFLNFLKNKDTVNNKTKVTKSI